MKYNMRNNSKLCKNVSALNVGSYAGISGLKSFFPGKKRKITYIICNETLSKTFF